MNYRVSSPFTQRSPDLLEMISDHFRICWVIAFYFAPQFFRFLEGWEGWEGQVSGLSCRALGQTSILPQVWPKSVGKPSAGLMQNQNQIGSLQFCYTGEAQNWRDKPSSQLQQSLGTFSDSKKRLVRQLHISLPRKVPSNSGKPEGTVCQNSRRCLFAIKENVWLRCFICCLELLVGETCFPRCFLESVAEHVCVCPLPKSLGNKLHYTGRGSHTALRRHTCSNNELTTISRFKPLRKEKQST